MAGPRCTESTRGTRLVDLDGSAGVAGAGRELPKARAPSPEPPTRTVLGRGAGNDPVLVDEQQAFRIATEKLKKEIEDLKKTVAQKDQRCRTLEAAVARAAGERDEWRAKAHRHELNREFHERIQGAEASGRRIIKVAESAAARSC